MEPLALRPEEQLPPGGHGEGLRPPQELHQPRADPHGDAHDDALGDARDDVLLAVVGRVEEVVRGLLEGGQHQHALLHLGQAVAGDAWKREETRAGII